MRSGYIAGGVSVLLLLAGVVSASREMPLGGGWGVDACLSCHLPIEALPGYFRLLKTSDIRWLRERDIGHPKNENRTGEIGFREERLAAWKEMRANGFHVLAFASLPNEVPVEDAEDQLPEDLLAVYRQTRILGKIGCGTVDAWEMANEPEMPGMTDLPDRVVACQKATYLGIKAGSSRNGIRPDRLSSPVLMGALAFPPGPWLETAAENGLYDYTDGVNFHHYGFARDLTGLIETQRASAAQWSGDRDLPLWLTEVGLNNAPYRNPNEPNARARQAAFLVECARQAMQGRLAVFMPYILVHHDDPFAMTDSPTVTWPAWQVYSAFTNSHRLQGPRSAVAPPRDPNPIVLQWLPDEGACSPDKVSLTYDFDREPDGRWSEIEGKIRIYNLSQAPVRIRLKVDPTKKVSWRWLGNAPAGDIVLGPETTATWPIEFQSTSRNYVRESIRIEAETIDDKAKVVAISPLVFGLQTFATIDLPHRVEPIKFTPTSQDGDVASKFAYISEAIPEVTSTGGLWLGINGAKFIGEEYSDFVFDVVDHEADPLSPPMAIAALPEGLPLANSGFLRLRALDGSFKPEVVRVDLIDKDGQRFSILENFGRRRDSKPTGTVLLAYADFHRWFFGRCVPGAEKLDPTRIREVQLRFFKAGTGKKFRVHLDIVDFGGADLSWITPAESSTVLDSQSVSPSFGGMPPAGFESFSS